MLCGRSVFGYGRIVGSEGDEHEALLFATFP
jgi:hypothetical protein